MKKDRLTRLGILVLVSTILLVWASPALADNVWATGNDTQPIVEMKSTPEYHKWVVEKNQQIGRIMSEIDKNHGIPTEAHLRALEALKKTSSTKIHLPTITTPSSSGESGVARPRIIYYNVLGVSATAQATDYYCGPASAYQLLNYLGITSYNGKSLTQANLASALQTTRMARPGPALG